MSKSLLKYYTVIHFFIFILLISFIFYATPTADDYTYAYRGITHNPITNVIDEYMNWASRYTQVFITSARYHLTNGFNTPYYLWLSIYILIFMLCIFYFINTFFSSKLTVKGQCIATLILSTGIIKNLPTLDESIFWEITSITYVLTASLLILLFTFIYKNNNTLNKPIILCTLTCLVFFISGLNQVAFIIIFIFFISRYSFLLLTKQSRFIDLLIILLPIFTGIIMFLSPGRSNRMHIFPNSGKLIYSISFSILSGTQALLQALADPYIWGSIILFLPFLISISNNLPKASKKFIIIYTLSYLSMLYSIEFAHYFGTGEKPVQRLMTIWYILFFIGIIVLAIISSVYIKNIYNYLSAKFLKFSHDKIKLPTVIIILTFSSLLLINNPPKAIYDLIYNIPGYLEEKDNFYSSINRQLKTKNKVLILKKFKYDPILLKTPTGADYGLSEYFGFKKTKFID